MHSNNMADSPEPLSRRPSSASTAPHLRYPTLPPLSGSVEEWLSRSRPTIMTSTPLSDHTSKSLSESWATLSASDAHSEDGARSEQTDAESLIDQTGPDDVASLDERYSSSEIDGNGEEESDEEEYGSKSNASKSQELPALFRMGDAIDDSDLTAKAAFHPSTESIEFIEPEKWPEVERIELKHTIQVFEGAEDAELKEQLSSNLQDSFLIATVQQTMTRQSLDTEKPFRVLYIGNPEFRNIILDKIGDVLVSSSSSGFESSSTESSRYHVVPTSFGAGAVPNFAELLPIHFQLIVDECLGASSNFRSDRPSTISLNFKNRPPCTSSWTGTEYTISSSSEFTLPDVSILFKSCTDTPAAVETQQLARIFMERHGVPTMAISEKPLWKMTSELIPLNHHSLHMCLESRSTLTGKSTVLKRYPIDLKTFESITPGQLNRNLASLASIYPKRPSKVTSENPKPSFNIAKYTRSLLPFHYLNGSHKLTPVLRLIILTIISAVVIRLGHSALQVTIVFLSQLFARSAVSNLASPALSSITNTSILPVEGLKQTSLSIRSSTAGEVQVLNSQPTSHAQVEELIGAALSYPEQETTSDRFEVQVVGDCHLVLKPPRMFFAARKQPKFNVQVSRRDVSLDYELSKLFEGVYTLRLDRGDAYGLVDIKITANSKPPLNQTTSVDFGTPWLKIANWKRAAQAISSQLMRELVTAQTGLSEVYGRLCTDLQVLMGDVVKKAHFLRREADLLRHDPQQASLETTQAVLSRSKQLSEAVRRTAMEPLRAASSALQVHTGKVNKEAQDIISDTWNRISTCARGFDLGAMMDHVRNVRKCKTLDKAQRRAKGLMMKTWQH